MTIPESGDDFVPIGKAYTGTRGGGVAVHTYAKKA